MVTRATEGQIESMAQWAIALQEEQRTIKTNTYLRTVLAELEALRKESATQDKWRQDSSVKPSSRTYLHRAIVAAGRARKSAARQQWAEVHGYIKLAISWIDMAVGLWPLRDKHTEAMAVLSGTRASLLYLRQLIP
jgi:hypothetical protein